MKKIRKNDEVIVIAGKYKGKIGKVLRILPVQCRAVVDGVNVAKKHVKPNPAKNIVGGVMDHVMSIHLSNIAIYNQETKKADRIGFRVEDGKRVRFLKSTGKVVN